MELKTYSTLLHDQNSIGTVVADVQQVGIEMILVEAPQSCGRLSLMYTLTDIAHNINIHSVSL